MFGRHLKISSLVFGLVALTSSVPSFSQEVKDAIKAEPTHYKLAFENDSVAVVNVHYGPHEKSKLHSHPGGVVVALTPGHLRFTDEDGKTREVQALRGEARWFPPLKHSVENLGNAPYDGVYIEVKPGRKSAQAASSEVQEIRAGMSAPDRNTSEKRALVPSAPATNQSTLIHK